MGNLSGSLLTVNNGSLELLDGGLQSGLVSLVLLVSDLGLDDILLRGLNVGHVHTSCSHIGSHTASYYSAVNQENQSLFSKKFTKTQTFFRNLAPLPRKQSARGVRNGIRGMESCGPPSQKRLSRGDFLDGSHPVVIFVMGKKDEKKYGLPEKDYVNRNAYCARCVQGAVGCGKTCGQCGKLCACHGEMWFFDRHRLNGRGWIEMCIFLFCA